jgi:hypothetical protein
VALVAGVRIVNLKATVATFVTTKNCGQAMNYIINQQSFSFDIYGLSTSYLPVNQAMLFKSY